MGSMIFGLAAVWFLGAASGANFVLTMWNAAGNIASGFWTFLGMAGAGVMCLAVAVLIEMKKSRK